MIPIHELLHRIEWDAAFGDASFEVGYLDRVAGGIVRVALKDVHVEKEPTPSLAVWSGAGELQTIPLHRVRAVWRNGEMIWRRGGPPRGAALALVLAAVMAFAPAGRPTVSLSSRAGPASSPSSPAPTQITRAPQALKLVAELEHIRDWTSAVEAHEIGAFDDHAARIAAWRSEDVYALLTDLPVVFKFVTRQGGKALGLRGALVPAEQVREALGLTVAEWQAGDVTRLVRRAALLHADIARLGGRSGPEWGAIVGEPRPRPAAGVVFIADGQVQSTGQADGHWRFGRYLVDRVKAGPSRDPVAAAWYRAAAAYLLALGSLADGQAHLEDALEVLPDDAVIQFYEGVLHEAIAAPNVQVVLESGPSFWGRTRTADAELRRARSAHGRAVEQDRSLVEARLHLGRVLGQLGSHADAARELRLVVGQSRDPLVSFYGGLFLGAEEEALGRLGPARAAYRSAEALYPQAQSVRMALAQLSWREGDRAAARDAVTRALSAAAPKAGAAIDPWWTYPLSAGRHTWTLFDEACRTYLREEGRR